VVAEGVVDVAAVVAWQRLVVGDDVADADEALAQAARPMTSNAT